MNKEVFKSQRGIEYTWTPVEGFQEYLIQITPTTFSKQTPAPTKVYVKNDADLELLLTEWNRRGGFVYHRVNTAVNKE